MEGFSLCVKFKGPNCTLYVDRNSELLSVVKCVKFYYACEKSTELIESLTIK